MNKSAMIYKTLLFLAVLLSVSFIQSPVFAQTEKGIDLFNYWDFKKAEDAFREVLKNNPADAQAGYYLGMSLIMQEKYQEALNVLKKVKASGKSATPNEGQLKIALARAYLGLKNYPEALEYLNVAEEVNADPVEYHTYRGAYYLGKKDANKAVKELDKAIDLNSQNPYTYYHAGFAYLSLGNAPKAVKLFEMFLRLAPYAPEAEKVKFLVNSLC
ncbi:tetratricopeptide repeat protein [Thermodesulfobacteriota bacterium]